MHPVFESTLRRVSLPVGATESWLRDALTLTFPDPRDLTAWRAFVDASVRLAKAHLPADLAQGLSAGLYAAARQHMDVLDEVEPALQLAVGEGVDRVGPRSRPWPAGRRCC